MSQPPPPVPTERLWLTEPRRTTCLSKVAAVRGFLFALDRSPFAPTSHAHRHPQPADRGTVWISGEKRRLERVFARDGTLWHQLRGTVPPLGAQVQCHLDTDRRDEASRAHTAMHLLLAAMQASSPPALARDPEVKGGGSFRLELAGAVEPKRLAGWLAQANAWARANAAVSVEHVPRDLAPKALAAQRFDPPDPYPGPETVLDAVRVAGVGAFPCDGTHVARTGQVGRIVVAQAHAARQRFVIVGKAGQPATA